MLRQARKWNHIKCSINPQQEKKKNHDKNITKEGQQIKNSNKYGRY